MTCPCGCGGEVKPGNRWAQRGCTFRYGHASSVGTAKRLIRQRVAMANQRIDRWAQPAYERIRAGLEREGLTLTHRQRAVVMLALAEAVAQAHHQGRHAARELLKYHARRKGQAAA